MQVLRTLVLSDRCHFAGFSHEVRSSLEVDGERVRMLFLSFRLWLGVVFSCVRFISVLSHAGAILSCWRFS